jgi:putative hydrolase of the HAD superfamily
MLMAEDDKGEKLMDGKRPRIRAVTFDFWGTLYDNREADSFRLALIQDKLHVDGDLRQAYERAHQLAHHYWRAERRPLLAAGRLEAMLDHLGVSMCQRAKAELVTGLEEALLQVPPEPVRNVRYLLHALQDQGVRLGLISDTGITPGRVLRTIMGRDGLLNYFQHCTFSDEIGRSKPDPLPFEHTLEALGAEASLATHIGDLPETDIAGAKAMGMRAVLFTGITPLTEGTHRADVVLASYDDIEAALHALGEE